MCKRKDEGKRCILHYTAEHRRLGSRALQILGASSPENRAKIEALENSGLLSRQRSTRARVAEALTDAEDIRIAMKDKAVDVQMALARNRVVRASRELSTELASSRPVRGGGTGPQDQRVLAILAGETLSARERRRLAETPEVRAARLAKESPQQREYRLSREKRWERLASEGLPAAEAEDDELDDVFDLSEEELAEILGEEQEDFDFSLTTAPVAFFSMREAERIFESLKADPSFAETLTAEQLGAAWDALPEDRKMPAAEQLRTNHVVLRRMLMDGGTRASAFSSIVGSLPEATIASTISTLLEGHRGLEQSYALGVMLEGLQSRGLVADDAVGDPADLAGAWLAEYQAAA